LSHAAENAYAGSNEAHLHAETLDDMLLAAWHLDTLGLKIQFTSEISRSIGTPIRIRLTGHARNTTWTKSLTSRRLETLRDAITQLREMYKEAGRARTIPIG